MRITSPIERALKDEHVLATDPPLAPQADTWRRRINAFTGRSLSHHALAAEQGWRAGAQRLHGQSVTAGVIEGLDLALGPGALGAAPDAVVLQLSPGAGITRSGEDITVPAARRLTLADVRVHARADHLDAIAGGAPVDPPEVPPAAEGPFAGLRPLLPRRTGPAFGAVAASDQAAGIPRAAVLVLEPVTATILAGEDDACPPDPRDDPYDDLQLIDGARLALYLWPGEMTAVAGGPDYALPPAGPHFRNALAWRVFEAERANGPAAAHPWEALGLPVALFGFNADWTLAFVDRASVVRLGGQPAMRTPLGIRSGSPLLWQARVAQFAEQMAGEPGIADGPLTDRLRFLPPTGFLPGSLVDLATRRQSALPASLALTAAPMPLDQIDLAIAEAAALDPVSLSAPDALELLLPVPGHLYEPRLLEVETLDPRFAAAIARFRDGRDDWLARREKVRRRCDTLVEAVTGTPGNWPAEDAPAAEVAPPGAPAPLSAVRIRRVAAGAAYRTHAFTGAAGTIPPRRGDRLYVWVRVADARSFTAITLRTGAATAGGFDKGVWWGRPTNVPFIRGDDPQDRRRVGDVPGEGTWTRLEVAAEAEWGEGGIAGLALDGMEFGQRGGTVEWGPLGLIDAQGRETVWLSEFRPEGSAGPTSDSPDGPWPWVDVARAGVHAEGDFGVVADGEGRSRAAAVAAFRDRWPQSYLAGDFQRLGEEGLERFVTGIEARLRRTNDRIDTGFLRARADIYRLRQVMLGADAASKLVTSPALADLAIRDQGARARAEDLTTYLQQAWQQSPLRDPDEPLTALPKGQIMPEAPPRGAAEPGAMLLAQPLEMTIGTLPLHTLGSFPVASSQPVESVSISHRDVVQPVSGIADVTGAVSGGQPVAEVAAVAQPVEARLIEPQISIAGIGGFFGGEKTTAVDVQAQRPLAGAVERTTSVAERLQISPAVEIHEYALAGKLDVLSAVSGLISGPAESAGIALGDLPAPGFSARAADSAGDAGTATLADVLARPGDFRNDDEISGGSSRHEADYFSFATKSIDNAVATLRLIEGRAELYKRLLVDARRVLDALRGEIAAAGRRLRVIDAELAEARHDLATAEALLGEERERVAAVNARRADTIRRYGGTLVFRRPRRTQRMAETPTAATVPALAPTPVAACRRSAHALPGEVEDYLALFHELPARAFVAVAAGIGAIDRLETARSALEGARTRAARAPVRRIRRQQARAPFAKAAETLIEGQLAAAETRRLAAAQIDLGAIASLGLVAIRRRFLDHATLGDVIEGGHGRPALSRRATAELEAIGDVAACLHAGFSDVAPVVRLSWAEALSAFDRPAPLRRLSALPRWGEVDIELRRELQGLTDWLFSRIEPGAEPAERAINELVRICVLMAAQSPVEQLIPAHLVAPAAVQPGALLNLATRLDLVRLGMTAVVRREDGAAVLRARVEDVGDGVVRARVTELVDRSMTTVAAGFRVDLGFGPR